ncbi:MAG: hypothetical protein HY584_00775 [Candidatus Omnitrophica bacterium]|nr:hypothetical protein [Candidatus Omnitrophota bacterium]
MKTTIQLLLLLSFLSLSSAEGWADELRFISDTGVRVDHASNPIAEIDEASGQVRLMVTLQHPHRRVAVVSQDGFHFEVDRAIELRSMQGPVVKLSNGRFRRFLYDPRAGQLRSEFSRGGIQFSQEPGSRYTPHPMDHGTFGVYDVFMDRAGGIVLLYVGDLHGLNNIRRAYSKDEGMNFRFEKADVLGDAKFGGAGRSFVDHKVVRLPGGELRLFAMREGRGIYSFISADEAHTFRQEPGARLGREDFREFTVMSLHDPTVIQLSDGRWRMYVCARLPSNGPELHEVIVSATTK